MKKRYSPCIIEIYDFNDTNILAASKQIFDGESVFADPYDL